MATSHVQDGIRALLLQEKYWRNPLAKSEKVTVQVHPVSTDDHHGRSWVEIKDLYWNGQEILGFYVFEARRLGYGEDMAVFRYACRKSISLEVTLLKLEDGLWSLIVL